MAGYLFQDHLLRQLARDWRKHPDLAFVRAEGGVRDGVALIGPRLGVPGIETFETTFICDEVVSNQIVTGLQSYGATVDVTLGDKNYYVNGDLWLDKPVVLYRGDKVHAQVHKSLGDGVLLVMRGYEVTDGVLPRLPLVREVHGPGLVTCVAGVRASRKKAQRRRYA